MIQNKHRFAPGRNNYHYTLILLLLLAVSIRGGRDFSTLWTNEEAISVQLVDLQPAFPDASDFTEQADGSIHVINSKGEQLGVALLSTDFSAKTYGYGGQVPVLITVDLSGRIISCALLANHESEEFLEYIYTNDLLNTWNGLPVEQLITTKVDAVTGATETADAIIHGVQQTAAGYSGTQVEKTIDVEQIVHTLLFVLLVVFAVAMTFRPGLKKWRTVYLLAVLLVMGLLTKKMLSVELMNGWLVSGLPWQSNWESILLLLLAVLMPRLSKPRFYCNYLCPMGAAQELAGKISPVKNRNFKLGIGQVSGRELYLSFIWIAILLGYTPALSKLEPFLFFSLRVSGFLFILFGSLVVLASFFYKRPWCSLCPTGCALDTLAPIRNQKQSNHQIKTHPHE